MFESFENMSPYDVSQVLKDRIQFYQKENEMMESIFSELKLLDFNKQLSIDLKNKTDCLAKIQETYGTKDLSVNAIKMAFADKQNEALKYNGYLNKMKMMIKLYTTRNQKILKIIQESEEILQSFEDKKNDILQFTPDELKVMENKLKNYQQEINKFLDRYPWLKNEDYNVITIKGKMNQLDHLQNEIKKLNEDLEKYNGLKPDLATAEAQLKQLKLENIAIKDKILYSQK